MSLVFGKPLTRAFHRDVTKLWKKKCFVIGLATQFLSCIGHLQLTIFIHWVLLNKLQELQFTIYMVQLITTQLQFCHNNSFSTIMQLPNDYNHNVMLMSFFFHPSKCNMWHYEDFLWFFKNIDIHCPLWLFILDGLGLWHVTQSKVVTWHINWIFETRGIYIYIVLR
jgi:hypothetical protein